MKSLKPQLIKLASEISDLAAIKLKSSEVKTRTDEERALLTGEASAYMDCARRLQELIDL